MKVMRYKGIELTEMRLSHWDGQTREMLVWTAHDTEPVKRTVIGLNTSLNRWHTIEDNGLWPFAAEMPKEELMDEGRNTLTVENLKTTIKGLSARCKELIKENEELKHEVSELKNSCSFRDYSDICNETVKDEDKIKQLESENKRLAEKLLISCPMAYAMINNKINSNEKLIKNLKTEKKLRRMTNRELKEWCAEGKGLFKNDYTNAAYTVFGYNVNSDEMNAPVGNWIHIRAWNETEWHEPLIEG